MVVMTDSLNYFDTDSDRVIGKRPNSETTLFREKLTMDGNSLWEAVITSSWWELPVHELKLEIRGAHIQSSRAADEPGILSYQGDISFIWESTFHGGSLFFYGRTELSRLGYVPRGRDWGTPASLDDVVKKLYIKDLQGHPNDVVSAKRCALVIIC